jgi:cytochrome c-type biogenesis protein CcmF
MLGTIGELLIFSAFTACLIAGFSFLKASITESDREADQWIPIGRASWGVMVLAVLGAAGVLVYLIITHQFQYHYVYNYSSRELPLKYLFSAFWAGQEGSFMLWIFYNGLIGLGLIAWAREYEAPVMSIISLCQTFLLLMILGAQIGPLSIGASPFITLAEKFPDAPMLTAGFVPSDGTGLNDLLQNYWMVIHPPTLFVGFSAMIVPFAYAIAGLWKKKYTDWVRPALPWALFANLILIVGITLGGYWAYVTLSFGGYWAWDPVENSSLVPWLVGMAGIHTMISQKKSGSNQKAALFLNILAYLLVIYSTFLTRSGILGDISVHSFVDLGLYNQLILWMGVMAVIGFGLFAYRFNDLPDIKREPRVISREFMMFTGAMILCALAAVIILGTSAPIFGQLFRESPSAVPISFYNKWTLPLSIGLSFLAGLGQLLWWNKMGVKNLNRVLVKPLALSIASTALVLMFTPFVQETVNTGTQLASAGSQSFVAAGLASSLGEFWGVYGTSFLLMLLIFTSFFALYGNGMVLWRIGRGNAKLAGGAVAHLGLVLIIFGILTSSSFSDPIATGDGVPMQGVGGTSRDNFIISKGQTVQVDNFTVNYTGKEKNARGRPVYKLTLTDPQGRTFDARPVVYQNDQEQWIQHPDVKKYVEKDIYVAVSPNAMFSSPDDGDSTASELTLTKGESATLGHDEYSLTFEQFDVNVDNEMVPESATIAVAAELTISDNQTGETRSLRPIYMVMQDRSQQYIQNRISDWDITITFSGMKVDSGSAELLVEGIEAEPEEWLVVQAYEKPFINILWLGALIMSMGFGLSIYRRLDDITFSRKRES